MKKFTVGIFSKMVLFLSIFVLIVPSYAGSATAPAAESATLKIDYDPIEYFIPEKRIQLEAEISDESGVKLVRCYFRSAGQNDYVFVPMKIVSDSLYKGILPAPSDTTQLIEYLFLTVNGDDQVVKTQTFQVRKKDETKVPVWQLSNTTGSIQVYTELPKTSQPPAGFSDSITMDIVESSARFGFVAGGIYAITQVASAGGVSGAAAAATSGGIVSTSRGLSTGAWIGIGVGAAAVIGGGAAALGGGGGGDGDSSPQPQPTTTTTTTSTTTTSTSTSTTTTTTTAPSSTTTTTTTPSSTTTTSTTTTTTIPPLCPDSARLEHYPDFSVVCGTPIVGLAIITEPPKQGVQISWQYGTNQGDTLTTDQNGRIVFSVIVNNTSDRLNWRLPDCGIQGGGIGFLCNSPAF